GLTLARELDDDVVIGWCLIVLGRVFHRLGDRERKNQAHEESLARFRKAGDVGGGAYSLFEMAEEPTDRGDYDQAARLYEESMLAAQATGDTWVLPTAHHWLGELALLQGNAERATLFDTESLRLARTLRAPWLFSLSLRGLAGAAAEQGRAERAARLLGAEQAIREPIGLGRTRSQRVSYERTVLGTRAALGEDTFKKISAEGKAMTTEQAVDYALSAAD